MAMDRLQRIMSFSPNMDGSAQHWLEPAQDTTTKSSSPVENDSPARPWHHSGTSTIRYSAAHAACMTSSNTQPATASKPKMQGHARLSLAALELPSPLAQERLDSHENAFEQSFAKALWASTHPVNTVSSLRSTGPVSGTSFYDGTSEHGPTEAGPAYARSINAQPGLTSRHAQAALPAQPNTHASMSLGPRKKASASLSICLWNEVSHNSQHTRPVKEMLREVLEIRYPAHHAGECMLSEEPSAAQALLAAMHGRRSCQRKWWSRFTIGA